PRVARVARTPPSPQCAAALSTIAAQRNDIVQNCDDIRLLQSMIRFFLIGAAGCHVLTAVFLATALVASAFGPFGLPAVASALAAAAWAAALEALFLA